MSSSRTARRTLLGGLLALGLGGGLAACGFRLRGSQSLPFDSVYIEAPANSPIAQELARNIRSGSTTRVVEDKASAAAVIEIIGETRERDVAAVDAQGRAREYRVRLRVAFRVRDAKGKDLLGATTLNLGRDLFARDEQMLAREYEETQLYLDMLLDASQQILRRLSALQR
jgi:LPS-assembly lipoprotein